MRSFFANLLSLTLPFNAGAGQARIVIGPSMPAPLDTYTTSDGRYQAGIIFYSNFDDTTYTYICVVAGSGGFTRVDLGQVLSGAVQEETAGTPSAITLYAAGSGQPTIKNILASAINIRTSVGALILRGDSVDISTLGGGSTGTINLDARVEVQVKGRRAYLVTYEATAPAIAPAVTLAVAAQAVPGATHAVTTVTSNARYKAIAVVDFDPSIAGATVCVGELVVDGVVQPAQALWEVNTVDDRSTVTQVYSGQLAVAGAHTFDLQVRKTAAVGTIAANIIHTGLSLTVLETG